MNKKIILGILVVFVILLVLMSSKPKPGNVPLVIPSNVQALPPACMSGPYGPEHYLQQHFQKGHCTGGFVGLNFRVKVVPFRVQDGSNIYEVSEPETFLCTPTRSNVIFSGPESRAATFTLIPGINGDGKSYSVILNNNDDNLLAIDGFNLRFHGKNYISNNKLEGSSSFDIVKSVDVIPETAALFENAVSFKVNFNGNSEISSIPISEPSLYWIAGVDGSTGGPGFNTTENNNEGKRINGMFTQKRFRGMYSFIILPL